MTQKNFNIIVILNLAQDQDLLPPSEIPGQARDDEYCLITKAIILNLLGFARLCSETFFKNTVILNLFQDLRQLKNLPDQARYDRHFALDDFSFGYTSNRLLAMIGFYHLTQCGLL